MLKKLNFIISIKKRGIKSKRNLWFEKVKVFRIKTLYFFSVDYHNKVC